jgi:type VI secretion system protein ImpJ
MRKISWQDGMFIHPHHFQQQDLCWEGLIVGYHNASPYFSWGLLELELEASALRMNKVIIKRCAGILPDGTLFNSPEKDRPPMPIDIPTNYNNQYVYIGVSLSNNANPNFASERDLQFRYSTHRQQYLDLHSKDSERKDIDVCKLNLNLLLSKDDLSDLIYIPILKVISAVERVVLDEKYIPPTIRAQSCPILRSYITKVMSLLHSYVNTHLKFLRADEVMQYSDKTERWLIFQTVHRYQYLFSILSQDPYLLPYRLFELMVDVVGGVSAFTTTNVFEMPKFRYDHNDLAASFKPLLDNIEQIFTDLSRKKVVKLDCELSDNLHSAVVPQDLDLLNAEFILSVTFKERFQNQQHLFKHVKIAAASEIKKIIGAQVGGIKFIRLQELSPYVQSEKDTVYLQLMPEGYLWNQFIEQRDISIYTSIESQQIQRISLWIIAK